MVRTHPVPGLFFTVSVPPSATTLRLAMDSPSPSPLLSVLRCVKGVNMVSAVPSPEPRRMACFETLTAINPRKRGAQMTTSGREEGSAACTGVTGVVGTYIAGSTK